MSRIPNRAVGTAALAATLWVLPARAQDADPAPEKPARPVQHHRAAPPKPKPAPAPAPAAAKATPVTVPVPAPADLQPVQHARNAGVSACLAAVGQASAATVDAPHKAHSTWVTSDPDSHVFQSIVGLDYRNKTAPNAASIISATPTPGRGCDTTTVQVYPTARSCPQLRAELLKDGSLTVELSGMPLVRSASGFQHLLLPAPGNGCVIVAVGLGVVAPKAGAQSNSQIPLVPTPPPTPTAPESAPARR